MSDGYTVKTPDLVDGEILPSGWHDIAEAKGVPDEQIYASWRRFKQVTKFPWELRRWRAWIEREIVKRGS